MTAGKTIALTVRIFVGKAMSLLFGILSLLFGILSKFVITFLPRSKWRLISQLQSLSTVILEPKKIKSATISIFTPGCCDLSFLNVKFQASFFTLFFHPHQEDLQILFTFCHEWYHLHIRGCWYFSRQSWFQFGIHPAWHFSWYILHIGGCRNSQSYLGLASQNSFLK